MSARLIGSSIYTLVVSALLSEVDSLSRVYRHVCSVSPRKHFAIQLKSNDHKLQKQSKKNTQPLLDMEEVARHGSGRCFSFDSSAKFAPKFFSKILM